jgi:hypothetical protein
VATYQHRPADALRWADSAIAADSRYPRGYSDRALARLATGDTAGAALDANRAVAYAAQSPTSWTTGAVHAVRAVVLAAMGDTAAARSDAEISARHAGHALSPSPFVALGDRQRALDILESLPAHGMRCLASRWPLVAALDGDPRYDRLTASCPWRLSSAGRP